MVQIRTVWTVILMGIAWGIRAEEEKVNTEEKDKKGKDKLDKYLRRPFAFLGGWHILDPSEKDIC